MIFVSGLTIVMSCCAGSDADRTRVRRTPQAAADEAERLPCLAARAIAQRNRHGDQRVVIPWALFSGHAARFVTRDSIVQPA